MVTGDKTFRLAVSIITVAMVIPAVPIVLAGDLITASVRYRTFLSTIAVGYGFVVFVSLEWWSLDHPSFAVASLVWPWVVFFAAIFGVVMLNAGEQIPRGPIADIVRTLYGNGSIWDHGATSEYVYGAVFTIAGVGAVALSSLLQRSDFQPTEYFQ